MNKIIVSNFEVTKLTPKTNSPAINKLLPKTLIPVHCEFKISGVSNAVSNAIRRTIACELPVNAMFAEYSSLVTNEVFIIPEMVLERFKMIPLDQKCPLDAVFELNAVNHANVLRDVKASEIKIIYGGSNSAGSKKLTQLPFNDTFTLFTLHPGKHCIIKNIHIKSGVGHMNGEGMYALAVNTASVALDQKPINTFEPNGDGGICSRVADPRVWKVSFNTNGSMDPEDIIKYACDNIVERIGIVADLLYSIENNQDEYTLLIPNETHTIGNLFMRMILDLYPSIRGVVWCDAVIGRSCTLKIRTDDDINEIMTSAIKTLIAQFKRIKEQL